MDTYAPTHSVGGVLYIHPESLRWLHLIVGAGANFSEKHNLKANGAYIEVGLGILKIIPLLVILILPIVQISMASLMI